MTVLPWIGPPQMAEQNLSHRLDALAELVKIGRLHEETKTAAGFSKSLLDDSEAVLRRAGERLRLSGNHTVVALAGGTGSGKSTLFNALAGATFSQPGVTRPTTRHVHACVWGMQGAAPLLDWLGVQRRHRYARASALDSGESALDGLLLLDLPDHDSVVTASMAAVDRLSKLADMLVWVLDPQKYADASVHNRYLIPLAGHAAVFTVVLNQIDLLPEDQVKDCENDLRRLLDAEGLADTPVLPVSARTGAGVEELRELLVEAVSANRAAGDRISADIDSVAGGFDVYAGPQVAPDAALASLAAATGYELSAPVPATDARPPWELSEDDAQAEPGRPPWEDATPDGAARNAVDPVIAVPEAPAADLTEAFAAAAGLTAVAESAAGARQAVAARFTGWPPALLARRGSHDPVRSLRGRTAEPAAGAAGHASQSEVDNAINAFADKVTVGLPEPWSTSLRAAARSNAGQVPRALAGAVREAVPGERRGAPVVAADHRLAVAADGARGGRRRLGRGDRRRARRPGKVNAARRRLADPVAARHGGGAAAARLPDRLRLPQHGRGRRRARAAARGGGDARADRRGGPRHGAHPRRPGDRAVRALQERPRGGGGFAANVTVRAGRSFRSSRTDSWYHGPVRDEPLQRLLEESR